MGLWLKQSTAVDVQVGPAVDSTDGNTEEGGLTITQGDVLLSKNGAAWAQKNDATACTVDATNAAFYKCPLNATDTGTLGRLQLSIHESGSLIIYHEFMVVPANVYDSLVGGSDYLQADTVQLAGTTQDATDLADFAATGYNPATHKVAGVVLTDTCTTNTDMVDYSAEVAHLDDDITSRAPASEYDTEMARITANVATEAKQDIIDGVVDNILRTQKNKMTIVGTTLTIYADDGTTPLYQFTLDDGTNPTSRTPV
jgi:hypothetical protein